MERRLARGEVWQLRFASPDKRRPVLVVSRQSLLEVLHTATVAPITTQMRGSPTEVELDIAEGLKTKCCVNLANLLTVRQSELRRFVGTVGPEKMRRVCRAISIATGCED